MVKNSICPQLVIIKDRFTEKISVPYHTLFYFMNLYVYYPLLQNKSNLFIK